MTMTCPRCRMALEPCRHRRGIAWRCAGCGGQSLNFSQFRRMVPDYHANDIWEAVILHPLVPRREARCPECRREMSAVLLSVHQRDVELDVCRDCQRLWLDRQEAPAEPLVVRTSRQRRLPE